MEEQRAEAVRKIEDIFLRLLQQLKREDALSVDFSSRRSKIPRRSQQSSSSSQISDDLPLDGSSTAKVSFPGSTVKEATRFTVIIRVLSIIHAALVTDEIVTKREIYYKDPELFGNQGCVDRIVDDLAFMLHLPRHALNVVAAPKGLFVGDLEISRLGHAGVCLAGENSATLIPMLDDMDIVESRYAEWILIVEKEAIFTSIVGAKIHSGSVAHGQGIVITGKGYPDLVTRAFLQRLSLARTTRGMTRTELVPIFALVDADPDGIAILSTYKHGSESLAHEGDHLIVPRIQWLGLKGENVVRMSNEDTTRCDADGQVESERGLLRLTSRDRQKAVSMMRSGPCAEHGEEAEGRRELQFMLMTNIKAETELLSARPGGLERWLADRLPRHQCRQIGQPINDCPRRCDRASGTDQSI